MVDAPGRESRAGIQPLKERVLVPVVGDLAVHEIFELAPVAQIVHGEDVAFTGPG